MLKKLLIGLIALIYVLGGAVYWYNNVNHAYRVVSEDKVYKSGLIPPHKLDKFLIPNKIKTVIDLLEPNLHDALNPASQDDINKEAKAIEEINKKYGTNIKHINIQSSQIPNKKTLTEFYKIIDDPKNYPIHIHCYHGMGRAVMYSAIYRIEKEGWSVKKAQENTRLFKFLVSSPLHHSSFSKGRGKGDFLLNYRKRGEVNATVDVIK